MLVEQSLTFAVPNGLSTDIAALTEPMAVGLHAVRRSDIKKSQVARRDRLRAGRARGHRHAEGERRAHRDRERLLGRRGARWRRALGADVVVDPAQESPFASADDHGHLTNAPEVFDLAVGTMDKLRRIPLVPWHRIWQLADATGLATPKHPVIFECVGVPGVIDQLMSTAPLFSRIVVVGVCMQPDTIRPAMAINKEIDLRFVLGYTPAEFRESLHLLADGKVNAAARRDRDGRARGSGRGVHRARHGRAAREDPHRPGERGY